MTTGPEAELPLFRAFPRLRPRVVEYRPTRPADIAGLRAVAANMAYPRLELAAEIASKPPHAVRLAKRLLRHSAHMGLDEFLDLSAAFQAASHHTADHAEAMDAFFDKRSGEFRGA